MQHKVGSWEKEYTFQPNIRAAKDDWRHQQKANYMYPPRHTTSGRNDVKFVQDSTLGLSFHRHPVGLPKNPTPKQRLTRVDPLVADRLPSADTSSYRVSKSSYRASSTPSGGIRAAGRIGSGSPSMARTASRPPTATGNSTVTDPATLKYYSVVEPDDRPHTALGSREDHLNREHATHPLESRERMYRESVRERRNEHLRMGTVEPEWERQRVVMDLVGAKSAENLIEQGYDPRYRPIGGMLDVRNKHRTMSARDRSAMTNQLFPENYAINNGKSKVVMEKDQVGNSRLADPAPYLHRDQRLESQYEQQQQQALGSGAPPSSSISRYEYLNTYVPSSRPTAAYTANQSNWQPHDGPAGYRSSAYRLPASYIPAEASFGDISSRYGPREEQTSYYPHRQVHPLPEVGLYHGNMGPVLVAEDVHSIGPLSEPVLSPPRGYQAYEHSLYAEEYDRRDHSHYYSSTPNPVDRTPPLTRMMDTTIVAGHAGPILFDGEHIPTPAPEPFEDDREVYVPDVAAGYIRLSPEQVRTAQLELERPSFSNPSWQRRLPRH